MTDRPLFIGIGHQKQQGKDTFAEFLVDSLEDQSFTVETVGFADPLKSLAQDTFGLTFEQCYGSDEDKNSLTQIRKNTFQLGLGEGLLNQEDNVLMTAREVLQALGVVMRRAVDGIWVNAPFLREYDSDTRVIIITDTRFQDEAERILSEDGILLKIVRPGHESIDAHASETSLLDFTRWDEVIVNDGTLDELRQKAENVTKLICDRLGEDYYA